MLTKISQAELTLLEYLHKHSGNCDERIWLDPKPITRDLRISMDQLAEESTALAAQGLAGFRDFRPEANEVPSQRCSAIWLTRKGKDYVRQARAESHA